MSDVSSNFSLDDTLSQPEDESLLPQIREAQVERGPLYAQGIMLQHRLSRYFSYKKSLHSAADVSDDDIDNDKPQNLEGSVEQEQRYLRSLTEFDQARERLFQTISTQDESIEIAMEKLREKEVKLADLRAMSRDLRATIAENAINPATKRPVSMRKVEALEEDLVEANSLVSEERIRNIMWTSKLQKFEGGDRTADSGPQLIDFEQLRLENHSVSDKIEERNEELTSLKRKVNSTIQMTSHIKQKLDYINVVNNSLRQNVSSYDEDLAAHRNALTNLKKAREDLRDETIKLRKETGLIGNPLLFEDFLTREDRIKELQIQVESLKSEYSQLVS
ncbi:hypothetical protein GEMRC1_008711 [Eukaryota sp. GEM-RC1]